MTIDQLAKIIYDRCRNGSLLAPACEAIPYEVLMPACYAEAEFQGTDMEELGSSDISCMARSAIRAAGGVL